MIERIPRVEEKRHSGVGMHFPKNTEAFARNGWVGEQYSGRSGDEYMLSRC